MELDPLLDGLDLMERSFQRAFHATGAASERALRLGDQIVHLRFVGDSLEPQLTAALRHLECEPTSSPHFSVDLWDSTSTATSLSPLLQGAVDLAYRSPFESLTTRQEVRLLTNERVSAAFDLGSGVLSMFDKQNRRGSYWVADGSTLPYYERGAPLRTLLNWWLEGRGIHCAHAAAVGTPDGAVLLTGKGGSGKSTSALACIGSQLNYVGDDYCAFSVGPEPTVHSLYNTAKLNGAQDLDRQPTFEPWIVNPDADESEKFMMFLQDHVPEQLLHGAPLRAVIVPKVCPDQDTRLVALSPAEALKALAPTSMFQLPGAARSAFGAMAALVRQLPTYRLESGPDITRIPEVLGEFLEAENSGKTANTSASPRPVATNYGQKNRPARISVIVPTYDRPHLLGETIQSILDQDYDDYQLTVVDDGSTEPGVREVVDSFDADILFVEKANGGIGSARNAGIRATESELIAFLDDDDLWTPSKLSSQVAVLDSEPELEAVYGWAQQFYDPSVDETFRRQHPIKDPLLAARLSSSQLIRRESFLRIGWFHEADHQGGCDVDWQLRANEKALRTRTTSDVVYRRRVHAHNMGVRLADANKDRLKMLKMSLDRRRQTS